MASSSRQPSRWWQSLSKIRPSSLQGQTIPSAAPIDPRSGTPIAPGMGSQATQNGYSTGAGPNGIIEPMRPVMQQSVQFHEGETVTTAEDTAAAGGPEGVAAAVEQAKLEAANRGRGIAPKGFYGGGMVSEGFVHNFDKGGSINIPRHEGGRSPMVDYDQGGQVTRSKPAMGMQSIMAYQTGGAVPYVSMYGNGGAVKPYQFGGLVRGAKKVGEKIETALGGIIRDQTQTVGDAGPDAADLTLLGDIGGVSDFTRTAQGLYDPPTTISPIPKAKTTEDVARETGLQKVLDVAGGESKLDRTIAQQAQEKLAGIQNVQRMVQAQEAAQTGLRGGAAEAIASMQQRQRGLEQAKLSGEIAISEQSRAEDAARFAATTGLLGKQFEAQENWNKMNLLLGRSKPELNLSYADPNWRPAN